MEYTRVDSKKLAAAIAKAVALLQQADEAVGELLVLLTPQGRASLPKPKDGFEKAARTVAKNHDLDALKGAAEYDSESVLEDLANIDTIDALGTALDKLQQRLSDSRLLWLGEAYAMSLSLYAIAKQRAKNDPVIAKAIEPLAEFFATPRLKKPTT